ncbi:DUF1302 domain-containing protein [Acidocella sp.]|uniref:DUF1302 domain-containing protein n=1 Tax=Acidocella sp. TaxID=50710 RepID=UPI0026296138|nr:DUF1302 family protein [Acidocella sp.]
MNNKAKHKTILAGSTAFRTRLYTGRIATGLACGALGIFLAGIAQPAHAMNLYDGIAAGNGIEVNLNVTLSYTGIVRTNNPSARLAGGFNASGTSINANGNDGDLNFRHGLVSDMFEVTPVLDIKDGNFGAHFSGDGYVNTSYLGTNQNNSPSSNNPTSIAKNNDFTSATRNVEGLNAQVLDAFVYGTTHFGADQDQSFTLKVGRQTLLWGQSLFLSNNGIAAGMAPFDVITADNNPNAETQQIILPVGQVVATYAPNNVLTLQGYYQFEWEPDLLEGAGSFFSSGDILDKGGQRLLLAPNFGIPRAKNITPPINNGQFGVSAQMMLGNYDLGLYALRYDSKAPTVYLGPTFNNYRVVYPRDIWIEGVGLSTTILNANVAGEMSFRQHMNLVTGANVSATNDANSNPAYPVGDTWAGQVSAIYVSAGVPLDPGGITYTGEIGFNHVLKVTKHAGAISQGRTSTAADMAMVITPNYYDVLPNLALGFPIGFTYNLYGRSAIDATENHGTGDVTVGVTATYKVTWIASLTYYDNIGAANPNLVGEPSVADRNYVMLNLQHAF